MKNKISPDFIGDNQKIEGTITPYSPESNKDEHQRGNQNNSSISEEVIDNNDSGESPESQDTNNQQDETERMRKQDTIFNEMSQNALKSNSNKREGSPTD